MAVERERWIVEAPARVFEDQADVLAAFKAGELEQDVVVVVRFQGPRANGMPELHKLTPVLGVLQDRGFKVALVTDGRMSGASGKVPAAIHLSPEALDGGAIARIEEGDMITVDCEQGLLQLEVDEAVLAARVPQLSAAAGQGQPAWLNHGRQIFELFRQQASPAEQGASPLWPAPASSPWPSACDRTVRRGGAAGCGQWRADRDARGGPLPRVRLAPPEPRT